MSSSGFSTSMSSAPFCALSTPSQASHGRVEVRLLAMSSIAGHVTHRYFGAYPVGKAGIESMVRNAADEYGHAGVRFNALQPGFITTEVMEGIERGGPVWNSYVEQTPLGGVARRKTLRTWLASSCLLSHAGSQVRRLLSMEAIRCGPVLTTRRMLSIAFGRSALDLSES